MDKSFLEGSDNQKTLEEYLDYVARNDLIFLTSCGHQIRFKVRLIFIAFRPNLAALLFNLVPRFCFRFMFSAVMFYINGFGVAECLGMSYLLLPEGVSARKC